MSITCILSAGVNRPTVFALAQRFIVVELIKERRQVVDNALQFYLRAVQQLVAVRAIPFEAIESSLRAWHLDDNSNTSRLPLRRAPHVFWQQQDVAHAEWNL